MIKLRDIPQNSKIFCEASDGSKFVIFNHLDGSYSYCTTEKDGFAHLYQRIELKKVKGGYEFA